MATTTESDAWTNRDWQIVRADLDLSHVFFPDNKLTFQSAERGGVQGYTLSHEGDGSTATCFRNTFLRPVGRNVPGINDIDKDSKPLPLLTEQDAGAYDDLWNKIGTYLNENQEALRLEGEIEIPCHAYETQLAQRPGPEHVPQSIKTRIHVYQVSNAMKGGRPLLYLQAPLSPLCPANGNGTVIGYS